MTSSIENDLATLDQMIKTLGDDSSDQGVVDAMEIWIEAEFPEDSHGASLDGVVAASALATEVPADSYLLAQRVSTFSP